MPKRAKSPRLNVMNAVAPARGRVGRDQGVGDAPSAEQVRLEQRQDVGQRLRADGTISTFVRSA
jgi:hypothetical protein